MYLKFYHLNKEPFHITPDPDFLFLSPTHKDALGSIIYGIEQRKGFVSIIGEVGTGKTTIIRSYLNHVNRTKVKPLYIFNARLTFRELLDTIFNELGITPNSDQEAANVRQLQEILIAEYRQDNKIVLIIDEAQNMPVETMENLRMLSNLETTTDKLLQIVLVGQPELERKLNLVELRQLKQRLAVKAKIKCLSKTESLEYIQHRINQASLSETEIFTPGALRSLVRHAQGNPRILNILCDNALITGYGYQKKPVNRQMVNEVIADFEGKNLRWNNLIKYAGAAMIVLLVGFLLIQPVGAKKSFWWTSRTETVAPVEVSKPLVIQPIGLPPEEIETEVPAIVQEVVEIEPTAITEQSRFFFEDITLKEQITEPQVVEIIVPMEPMAQPGEPETLSEELMVIVPPEPKPSPPVIEAVTAEIKLFEFQPEVLEETILTASLMLDIPIMEVPITEETLPEKRADNSISEIKGPIYPRIVVVQDGDVLSVLCAQIYGRSSRTLINLIKRNNWQIIDENMIFPGAVILFPESEILP